MILAWGAKVSPGFREKVVAICARLQCDPSNLMAAMAFETGETFSPSIVNPSSGATGLIQIMPSTAEGLGTSTMVLSELTAEEQLSVVERYLAPFTGRMKTLASLYMAILWPRAVDLPDEAVLFTSGQDAYLKNRGLDFNHDNAVTKAEAASFVATKLANGLLPGNAFDLDVDVRIPIRIPIGAAESSNSSTVAPQPEKPVPALALLQLFGPLLAGLIPQIAKLVKPQSEVAQRNVGIAQVVVDTLLQATGTPNLQAAIEKMQADPTAQKAAQQAIVTQPDIMSVLEVGGGIAAAREADLKVMESDKPFWKTSAVFWISTLLLPLVYWLVGSIVAGGIAEKLLEKYTDQLPAWTVVMLSLFGSGWTGEARSGAFNLVIGLILGGICGVYYGVSVTQQKQQNTANTTGTTA